MVAKVLLQRLLGPVVVLPDAGLGMAIGILWRGLVGSCQT